MSPIRSKTTTVEKAEKYISGFHAQNYLNGDEAEVTFPDGTKHIYVYNCKHQLWRAKKEHDEHQK